MGGRRVILAPTTPFLVVLVPAAPRYHHSLGPASAPRGLSNDATLVVVVGW